MSRCKLSHFSLHARVMLFHCCCACFLIKFKSRTPPLLFFFFSLLLFAEESITLLKPVMREIIKITIFSHRTGCPAFFPSGPNSSWKDLTTLSLLKSREKEKYRAVIKRFHEVVNPNLFEFIITLPSVIATAAAVRCVSAAHCRRMQR